MCAYVLSGKEASPEGPWICDPIKTTCFESSGSQRDTDSKEYDDSWCLRMIDLNAYVLWDLRWLQPLLHTSKDSDSQVGELRNSIGKQNVKNDLIIISAAWIVTVPYRSSMKIFDWILFVSKKNLPSGFSALSGIILIKQYSIFNQMQDEQVKSIAKKRLKSAWESFKSTG